MHIQDELWDYQIKEYLLPQHLWKRYKTKLKVIHELKKSFKREPHSSLMMIGKSGKKDRIIKVYEKNLAVCYIYIPDHLTIEQTNVFIYSIWCNL